MSTKNKDIQMIVLKVLLGGRTINRRDFDNGSLHSWISTLRNERYIPIESSSKNPDGTPDGFAIFEIDSKPTNAISVGETIGKGLSLQSIGDESATLLYQGQKLSFKLNKTKDKSDGSKNSGKADTAKK